MEHIGIDIHKEGKSNLYPDAGRRNHRAADPKHAGTLHRRVHRAGPRTGPPRGDDGKRMGGTDARGLWA